MIRKFLVALLVVVTAVALIVVSRAALVRSRQISATPAPPLEMDRQAAIGRLSRSLQFRTVSYSELDPPAAPVEHEAFIAWLSQAFPRVHAVLAREIVGGRSLLYTWKGTDPKLQPLLLMGHYDVVPVEPESEANWSHPPFSGAVADGFVWGRGAIDDKASVIGMLEAAELLVAQGFQPRRTILFAFGHDEEIGGAEGAAAIAGLLQSRGVSLEAVIDEGGAILTGLVPGVDRPLAVVGIAEKGILSVELTAEGEGGHSSVPPRRTQVGVIAAAVDRIQRRPFRAGVRGASREMFRWLAPEMPFGTRLIAANLWLFEPLLKLRARRSNSLNAMLRTTIAPTMVRGGVKDNVIPTRASAVINFRILPGDSVEGVLRHVGEAVNDPSVRIRDLGGLSSEPSVVSDPQAPQFELLARTIRQVYPEAVVAPYLVVGATDARHFRQLTGNIYRFAPGRLTQGDLARVHGLNERVPVDDYLEGIRFYRTLMLNTAGTSG